MRAKRVPTDREKDEREIMHMTICSQCALAHDVYTDLVLIQRVHSAVETCHVLHECPKTRAVMVRWKTLTHVAW